MLKQIDHEGYPGLEGMYYLDDDGLGYINNSGLIEYRKELNRQYRELYSHYFSEFQKNDDDKLLGWFDSKDKNLPDYPWQASCTMHLTAKTFDQLAAFEIAMDQFADKLITGRKYPIAQTMSCYEGMRKLSVYGLALGFVPLVTKGEDDCPVILRINDPDDQSVEISNSRHSVVQLKQLILNSHLFAGCSSKDFIRQFIEDEETDNTSYH